MCVYINKLFRKEKKNSVYVQFNIQLDIFLNIYVCRQLKHATVLF